MKKENKDIEKIFLGIDRDKVPKWFDDLYPEEEKPKGVCVKFNKGANNDTRRDRKSH